MTSATSAPGPSAPGPDAAAPDPVEVRVYRFTGPQAGGLFTVPERWCRECDLFAKAADEAAGEARVPVQVKVLPWWSRILGALRYGGIHPPVLIVDGRRIAQGHDVPSVDRIVEAIHAAAEERGHEVARDTHPPDAAEPSGDAAGDKGADAAGEGA